LFFGVSFTLAPLYFKHFRVLEVSYISARRLLFFGKKLTTYYLTLRTHIKLSMKSTLASRSEHYHSFSQGFIPLKDKQIPIYNGQTPNPDFTAEIEHLPMVTVTAKIGSIPKDFDSALFRFSQKKSFKKFLKAKYPELSLQKAKEEYLKYISQLEKLNGRFDEYENVRKKLLQVLFDGQGGEYADPEKILKVISDGLGREVVIEKGEKGEEVLSTDLLHRYVRQVFMSKRLDEGVSLHVQFYTNLWTDVASVYLGYIKSLDKSYKQFEKQKIYLEEFWSTYVKDKLKPNTHAVPEAIQRRGSPKKSRHTAFASYKKLNIADDLVRKGITISNFDTILSLTIQALEGMSKSVDLEATLKDNAQNAKKKLDYKLDNGKKILPLGFDPKASFPKFEEPKKLSDLVEAVEKMVEEVVSDRDYEMRKNTIKIKNVQRLFRDAILDKDGVDLSEQKLSPSAWARKHIDQEYKRWDTLSNGDKNKNIQAKKSFQSAYESICKTARDKIQTYAQEVEKLQQDWLTISDNQRDLSPIRELVRWYSVYVKMVLFPLNSKENFVFDRKTKQRKKSWVADINNSEYVQMLEEANLLLTQIQGVWKEFDAPTHSQSIYLTGFYRKPGDGCAFLGVKTLGSEKSEGVKRGETAQNEESRGFFSRLFSKPVEPAPSQTKQKHQLQLLLSFSDTFSEPSESGTLNYLTYTKEGQPYTFDDALPLMHWEYNTPHLSPISTTPEGESFVFDLQFGKNQLRKYIWGNQFDDHYHIFNPNSRLKLTSMRLMKKYNSKTSEWEYFVSLALYRLESTTKASSKPVNEKQYIIGVDSGENQLLSYAKIDRDGYCLERGNLSELESLSKRIKQMEKQKKSSLRERNYVDHTLRRGIKNAMNFGVRYGSSRILRDLLTEDCIVVMESESKGKGHSGKQGVRSTLTKLFELNNRTTLKSRQEIDVYQVMNGLIPAIESKKIEVKREDAFGVVNSENTSKLCSNCGSLFSVDGKLENYIDIESLHGDLFAVKTVGELPAQLDLKRYLLDKDKNNPNLNQTGENLSRSSNTYPEIFTVDLKKTMYVTLDTSRELSKKKGFKYLDKSYTESISFWDALRLMLEVKDQEKKVKNHSINLENEKEKWIKSLFNPRIPWYHDSDGVENFRCLYCGNYEPCDPQASLNIARRRLYEEEKSLSGEKPFKSFDLWYVDKLSEVGFTDGLSKWNSDKTQLA
jgi:hypothetical protein